MTADAPASVLLRGARIRTPHGLVEALRHEGGRITWTGASADAPPADVHVDCDGALVTTPFVDAHAHAGPDDLTTALRGHHRPGHG